MRKAKSNPNKKLDQKKVISYYQFIFELRRSKIYKFYLILNDINLNKLTKKFFFKFKNIYFSKKIIIRMKKSNFNSLRKIILMIKVISKYLTTTTKQKVLINQSNFILFYLNLYFKKIF